MGAYWVDGSSGVVELYRNPNIGPFWTGLRKDHAWSVLGGAAIRDLMGWGSTPSELARPWAEGAWSGSPRTCECACVCAQ